MSTATVGCSEVRGQLTALLDGELAPDERAAVEAHLLRCASCRAVQEGLGRAVARLDRLPEVRLALGFEGRFGDRLAAEERASERRRGRRRIAWPLGFATAITAAALLFLAGRRARTAGRPEELAIARRLELFENYRAIQIASELRSPEDVEVVAMLDQLESGGARR